MIKRMIILALFSMFIVKPSFVMKIVKPPTFTSNQGPWEPPIILIKK